MTRTSDNPESGMILVNVLAVLALASTTVFMMVSFAETSIRRSQRFGEAAQAAAYVFSGETSAIVALRRDGFTAPETDNLHEPWAALGEQSAPIENGTFSLSISDAQARFNINTVISGGAIAEAQFLDIVTAAQTPAATGRRIVERLKLAGPVERLETLADAGISAADLLRLSTFVTALPGKTVVNINTADEALLAILLGNPVSARLLASKRRRQGFLTPADVTEARTVLPAGLGFTSNHFVVATQVRIGGTTQQLVSLLERRVQNRAVQVVAIDRKR